MRRTLLLAVCLLALAAPRIARADEPAPGEHVVVLWHAYRTAEEKALLDAVHAFEKTHPGVRVRVMAVPYDGFASKLTTAIPRGNGPDLFIFAHGRIGSWVRDGVVEPITQADVPTPLSSYLPVTLEALTYKGKLYGLPLDYKSLALFYNKALVPTPPKTTDEMVALARGLSDPDDGKFGLVYPTNDFYFGAPWLFGFGGTIFGKDGKPHLDTKPMIDSLAFVQDLVLEDKVVPEEANSVLATRLFNEGAAGMVINGPWFVGEIDPKIDYGIAVLPTVSATGKPATPFLSVEGAMLAARAKDPVDALALADYLASAGAATRAIEGRQAVAYEPAYDDPRISGDPVLSAFRKQLDRAVPISSRPVMGAVWDPAKAALGAALRGIPPDQAAARAEVRLKAAIRAPPSPESPTPFLLGVGLLALVVTGFWTRRALLKVKKGAVGPIASFKKHRGAYAYLAPAMIGLFLLVLVPFAVGVAMGFTHHEGTHFTFVGLANFKDILFSSSYGITDPLSFYFTLVVTVMWTVANIALHVTIGLALALLLKESWLKLKGVYRALLIIPWAVPNYITALIWKGMFQKQFGAINGILSHLGIAKIGWFSHFWTAFTADVVTNTWLGFPFMMVVALGALQSIPSDLYEAAEVDGASRWQRFRHVTLPLLKPAMLPAVILGMVWTFNMFNIIYLVSGGEPGGATDILISDAYRWAFQRQEQYGYAAAYATLIFVILVVYTLATRKIAGGEEIA